MQIRRFFPTLVSQLPFSHQVNELTAIPFVCRHSFSSPAATVQAFTCSQHASKFYNGDVIIASNLSSLSNSESLAHCSYIRTTREITMPKCSVKQIMSIKKLFLDGHFWGNHYCSRIEEIERECFVSEQNAKTNTEGGRGFSRQRGVGEGPRKMQDGSPVLSALIPGFLVAAAARMLGLSASDLFSIKSRLRCTPYPRYESHTQLPTPLRCLQRFQPSSPGS